MEKRLSEVLQGFCEGYIAPFVWTHGEKPEVLEETVEKIYDCGINTLCLESRVHEDFCKEAWFRDLRFLITCLKKRNMKLWILDDKHFPSGFANGAFLTGNEHLHPYGITESHMDVIGPVEEGAVIISHHKPLAEDEILWVLACRREGDNLSSYREVLDVTENVCGNVLYCNLPKGMWRIVVISKTRKGMTDLAAQYCDKLNPEATRVYIDEVYEKHAEALGEEFGKTILGFFSDEPGFYNNVPERMGTEMGIPFAVYPYHHEVRKMLEEHFCETLSSRLPGLWLDFADGSSAEIRVAYMDVITRLYQKNFSEKLGKWCEEHGVRFIGHVLEDNNVHMQTGVGSGHYFRAVSGQHMGGVDVVYHQLLPGFTEYSHRVPANSGACDYKNKGCRNHVNVDFFQYTLAKLGSSAAQTDEKKQGLALCELYGAYGWAESMKTMKWLTDHMLVRGINYFVPHAFSMKENDEDCPPHFYAQGKNPHYPYFGHLMRYANRCAHLLSGGVAAIRCAVLYDAESGWTSEHTVRTEDVAKRLAAEQVDYHIVPFDAVLEAKTENGKMKIGLGSYEALLIPTRSYLPKMMEESFLTLAREGIPVIFVGGFPTITDNGERLSTEHALWETVETEQIGIFMKNAGFSDITLEKNEPYLRSYHYMRGGAEIYMLVNEEIGNTVDTDIGLRGCEEGAIVYHPMENRAYRCREKIHITLPPYHSVFVISEREEEEKLPPIEGRTPQKIKELCGTFEISVAENCGAYRKYCTSERLFNINGPKHLPNFAGFICYETVFEAPDFCNNLWLDLGEVGEIAELFLNETSLGCALIPPYRFELTNLIRRGENSLKVIVATHMGYAQQDRLSSFLLMEPTGLLGPVTFYELK